jgi:LmbE family N-acetylglucosaminyl deacetylase
LPAHHHPVIVLAPHPDDETFGCGGTIAMLTQSGVPVDVAFMTRGEQGTEASAAQSLEESRRVAELRAREALAACNILGVRQVGFLDGNDTRLRDQPELTSSIVNLLQNAEYHRVFCPWQHDSHDDHRATFALLKSAVATLNREQSFWLYEVWRPLSANTFVPIDNTIATKCRAMEQYPSQLSQLNYREGFLGLSAYRSLFCPTSRYAEAFFVCNRQKLLNLT